MAKFYCLLTVVASRDRHSHLLSSSLALFIKATVLNIHVRSISDLFPSPDYSPIWCIFDELLARLYLFSRETIFSNRKLSVSTNLGLQISFFFSSLRGNTIKRSSLVDLCDFEGGGSDAERLYGKLKFCKGATRLFRSVTLAISLRFDAVLSTLRQPLHKVIIAYQSHIYSVLKPKSNGEK